MESMRIRDYLPALYGGLLPPLFDESVPRETRASCDDCVMCVSADAYPEELELKAFSPDTKCCTYHPSLPNYLVGALLESTEPAMAEGQRRLREKIAKGIGITPRGVMAPRTYLLFYDKAYGFFGRTSAMKCPYYADGGCSIWMFRETICTTYFCKHNRGEIGKRFWETLKSYLSVVEFKLSLHVAEKITDDKALVGRWWDSWDDHRDAPTVEDLEERAPSEKARRAQWGEWFGREEEFYRACYRAVTELDRAQFAALVGAEETFLRHRLQTAQQPAASAEIPRVLKRNPELVAFRQGDGYVCASPRNKGDAFELNALVFPLLEAFDGRRDYDKVCTDLAVNKKVVLPKEMVARLYYLGVLVA